MHLPVTGLSKVLPGTAHIARHALRLPIVCPSPRPARRLEAHAEPSFCRQRHLDPGFPETGLCCRNHSAKGFAGAFGACRCGRWYGNPQACRALHVCRNSYMTRQRFCQPGWAGRSCGRRFCSAFLVGTGRLDGCEHGATRFAALSHACGSIWLDAWPGGATKCFMLPRASFQRALKVRGALSVRRLQELLETWPAGDSEGLRSGPARSGWQDAVSGGSSGLPNPVKFVQRRTDR